MVERHEPQRVPAPEQRPTSVTQRTPCEARSLICRSVTPLQRQTYILKLNVAFNSEAVKPREACA